MKQTRIDLALALASNTNNCVLWEHSLKDNGYGMVGFHSKPYYVHRWVCEKAHGQPPTPKHEAAHSCGTRHCINPKHLSWKTRSANQMDRVAHGTSNRGVRHGMAKLTEKQARKIKASTGTTRAIAKEFGVSQPTVSMIRAGTRWAWL